MKEKRFTIPQISCRHCVAAIKNELSELAGINNVAGDPATKTITVQWEDPASEEMIRQVLARINYPAD